MLPYLKIRKQNYSENFLDTVHFICSTHWKFIILVHISFYRVFVPKVIISIYALGIKGLSNGIFRQIQLKLGWYDIAHITLYLPCILSAYCMIHESELFPNMTYQYCKYLAEPSWNRRREDCIVWLSCSWDAASPPGIYCSRVWSWSGLVTRRSRWRTRWRRFCWQ